MRIELEIGSGPLLIPGIRDALEALTRTNQRTLRTFRGHIPPLYCWSGQWCHRVRYQMEEPGDEHWADILAVLRQGWGDCEDLACWRAAELRESGYPHAYAFPIELGIAPMTAGGPPVRLIHILVSRDGSCGNLAAIEDPSAVLGMPRIPLHILDGAVALACGAERMDVWQGV